VTVRLNVPDDEVFINACPAQLQNALLNLAINALDAMPNGGTLDLQVSADGPTARFRIIDSGPGLSDEVRSDPWELRQTVDGTGVGLAVTKAAIDAHDGRIVYHRAAAGRGRASRRNSPGSRSADRTVTSMPHALLVDDNTDTLEPSPRC
jgi:signal transduction histidine kinase